MALYYIFVSVTMPLLIFNSFHLVWLLTFLKLKCKMTVSGDETEQGHHGSVLPEQMKAVCGYFPPSRGRKGHGEVDHDQGATGLAS